MQGQAPQLSQMDEKYTFYLPASNLFFEKYNSLQIHQSFRVGTYL